MTVKVLKSVTVMGKTFNAPQYLPEGIPLTREEREKADTLDEMIASRVKKINSLYKKLNKEKKWEEIEKWRWLGGQINKMFNKLKNIEKRDIDNHLIWSAINQHLYLDLRRDADLKRAGTAKDHLRKCWLLFKSRGTGWIKNWAGWDALVDRGEQLVNDERLLIALERVFTKHLNDLDSRDYQYIFKSVAEQIPSGGTRKDIDIIKRTELKDVAEAVEKSWLNSKKLRPHFP